MLFYNNKNLKIIYGNTAAKTNNIVPTTNLYLFSSNVPAIISKTPKNPNITGKICENKVEIMELLELRDSLLPKLMSGEIKVN